MKNDPALFLDLEKVVVQVHDHTGAATIQSGRTEGEGQLGDESAVRFLEGIQSGGRGLER